MPAKPSALLHVPSPALGGCLFGGIERDTRGRSLNDAERFNYYPATPMLVVSWIFEGTLHLVEQCGPGGNPTLGPPLPRLLFSGPQRRPTASWSPGAVHALSVGFYPEALARLLDVSIERFIDRTVPLEAVADGEFGRICQAVLLNPENSPPFRNFEAQFQALWNEPASAHALPSVGNWLRSVATRAAHSAAGKGVRQLQRRIKHWTGQSQRDLQLFARVEQAFIRRSAYRAGAGIDLAGLAAEIGFSDQSHMGRQVRRITGLSPARLDERVASDEAFWYYRLIDGWPGGR